MASTAMIRASSTTTPGSSRPSNASTKPKTMPPMTMLNQDQIQAWVAQHASSSSNSVDEDDMITLEEENLLYNIRRLAAADPLVRHLDLTIANFSNDQSVLRLLQPILTHPTAKLHLQHLTVHHLDDEGLANAMSKFVATCEPTLQHLTLHPSPNVVKILSEAAADTSTCRLQTLELVELTPAMVPALQQFVSISTTLHTLRVRSYKTTAVTLPPKLGLGLLSRNRSLRHLTFPGPAKLLQNVFQSLPLQQNQLETLHLSVATPRDEGFCQVLGNCLKHTSTLTELQVNWKHARAICDNMTTLLSGLCGNKSVTKAIFVASVPTSDWSDNSKLTYYLDEREVYRFLARNHTLQHLKLHVPQMLDAAGASALATGLSENVCLQTLDLGPSLAPHALDGALWSRMLQVNRALQTMMLEVDEVTNSVPIYQRSPLVYDSASTRKTVKTNASAQSKKSKSIWSRLRCKKNGGLDDQRSATMHEYVDAMDSTIMTGSVTGTMSSNMAMLSRGLADNSSLQNLHVCLHVDRLHVGPPDVVRGALQSPSLIKLDLSNSLLTHEFVPHLLEALVAHGNHHWSRSNGSAMLGQHTLEELVLNGNLLRSVGVNLLFDFLAKHDFPLKRLSVCLNDIRLDGTTAEPLKLLLAKNTSLESLKLGGNHLLRGGMTELASGLKQHKGKLRELFLEGIRMSSQDMTELVKALQVNVILETLHVSIDGKNDKVLCQSLNEEVKLETLVLHGCISEAAAQALVDSLKTNTELKSFVADMRSVSTRTQNMISQCVDFNKQGRQSGTTLMEEVDQVTTPTVETMERNTSVAEKENKAGKTEMKQQAELVAPSDIVAQIRPRRVASLQPMSRLERSTSSGLRSLTGRPSSAQNSVVDHGSFATAPPIGRVTSLTSQTSISVFLANLNKHGSEESKSSRKIQEEKKEDPEGIRPVSRRRSTSASLNRTRVMSQGSLSQLMASYPASPIAFADEAKSSTPDNPELAVWSPNSMSGMLSIASQSFYAGVEVDLSQMERPETLCGDRDDLSKQELDEELVLSIPFEEADAVAIQQALEQDEGVMEEEAVALELSLANVFDRAKHARDAAKNDNRRTDDSKQVRRRSRRNARMPVRALKAVPRNRSRRIASPPPEEKLTVFEDILRMASVFSTMNRSYDSSDESSEDDSYSSDEEDSLFEFGSDASSRYVNIY